MRLKQLEIAGFKSFAKKSTLDFSVPISAIVGPNGSGKSNVAEALRFVLGEQSIKSLRGKRGEDLIFNGSKDLGRQNRAKVSLTFDNTNREFSSIDFDEVLIERTVHRDSSNEYFINGTQVRLRDVVELLATVHIGATGHHIISQGEADRILSASSKEKKSMIEDALGLRLYHWKIAESEKKLTKTRENMVQVTLLRKEIAPHIRFLKKQVEKIEQARGLREELTTLYREYLKRESVYLEQTTKQIHHDRDPLHDELKELEQEIARMSEKSATSKDNVRDREISELRGQLNSTREKKDELMRELGRIEGVIEYEEEKLRKEQEVASSTKERTVAVADIEVFVGDVEARLSEADKTDNVGVMKAIFANIRTAIARFSAFYREDHNSKDDDLADRSIKVLEEKKEMHADIERQVTDTEARARELSSQLENIQKEIEADRDLVRDSEKALFEKKARRSELLSRLNILDAKADRIKKEKERFREEVKEGSVLIGRDVTQYEQFEIAIDEVVNELRDRQEDRRRRIEKIKIRLEDIGGGSSDDVVKEYDEAVERDAFLAREIADMETSATALAELIADLTAKLDTEFKEGIAKINTQFSEFFALMFGGGTASLAVVKEKKHRRKSSFGEDEAKILESLTSDEEEPAEEGIEVNVNLPRKKIKGLQMLSGGERALTSIALLFAISQVNPPPFLVLDETDAALDEANSRKYGDMLENLSRYSQLIVITHNRETMSRVNILYGVTMGADAASKVLSVKFEEAEAYAK